MGRAGSIACLAIVTLIEAAAAQECESRLPAAELERLATKRHLKDTVRLDRYRAFSLWL